MSDQIVFQALNHHAATLGIPPHIATDIPGRYCGYFENEHREQFVFVYDRSTMGSLWLGDIGWETPITVIDGDAPTLILSNAERLWLAACWLAATELRTHNGRVSVPPVTRIPFPPLNLRRFAFRHRHKSLAMPHCTNWE